ncbi:hypothetical protein ACGTN6_13455 [Halomonas sp. THAF12]|uniref:hypothetical protein n=1 Tax=Halomonas sp. B23F22_10 TaxID=3459515 RepID=UPI00373E6D57
MSQPAPTALLPQDLLALAIDHERQELQRYRKLAFRFLTFGWGISTLMAALGIECEARLAELQQKAQEITPSPTPYPPAADTTAVANDGLIADRWQALRTLKRAMVRAEHAARIFMHCQESNLSPALQSLLQGMAIQKQAECHILRELIAAHDGEVAPDAQLASHPWPRGWLAGARHLRGMSAN